MKLEIKHFPALALMVILAGCAGGNATRTSANSMTITVSAAPVCGSTGSASYAAKFAALETIKAGFDGYIIVAGDKSNNVSTTQLPGQANTMGSYGNGTYSATTTYTPGPIIVSGSHDTALALVMFKQNEPGFANSVDARSTLGPDWEKIVKNGLHTC